jgi:hypothetical protein
MKMIRRTINLDEYLEQLSYEFKEECEDIYLEYIKNIKEKNIYINIKEKLFKNVNSKVKKLFKGKNKNIDLNYTELIKTLIKNKTYNLENLQKTFNPRRLRKDTFFYKEKLMKKKMN